MKKNIFNLVFFVLVLMIVLTDLSVFAVDTVDTADTVDTGTINYCKEGDTSANIVSRYKLKVTNTGGDNYLLSMNYGCEENVGFTVTSVNGNTGNAAVNQVVKCGSTVSISAAPNYDNDFGLPGVSVKVVSTGPIVAYKEEPDSCYWESADAEVYTTSGGSGQTTTVQYTPGDLTDPTTLDYVIDCDNNSYRKSGVNKSIVAGSFEDKFCNAKRKAIVAGKNYDFGSGKFTGNPVNFKCDYHIDKVPLVADELEGDDYFVNKSYLYGKTKLKKTANIQHHYYPGVSHEISTETLTCEIECEESVEVEYGPPVASVAGVCFEYNVRATSRVACSMTKVPPKANLCQNSYCTPYPQCVHSGGTIYTQAGPNTQYDNCIKNCDGGKYTKSCSNKCYKKVYGTTSANAKVKSSFDINATKVKTTYTKGANGANFNCNGYYNKIGDEIVWIGDEAGRWYCTSRWKDRDLSYRNKFYTDGAGFFRKEFSAGSLCNADCSWTQCGGKVYLNQYVPCDTIPELSGNDRSTYCQNGQVDVLKYDCDRNTEIYNDFVKDCMNNASCSTTTAEFTISTAYTKMGDGSENVLNFPYNNQKDTIISRGDVAVTTSDQKNSTLLLDYPAEGIGLLGCYKDLAQKDLYRSTWGFPSSWMNLKTGEISYSPDGKSSSNKIWYEHPHRFCIPGDAKGVNVLWYNAFMNRTLVEKHILEQTSARNVTECKFDSSNYSIISQTVGSYITGENSVKYNINAKTKKFGFLEWNIDVDCFYALNEDPICGSYENDRCETGSSLNPLSCTPAGGYRVHTIDLTDMFPNEEGAELADPSKSGRDFVGYNWSKYAINKKNVNYSSNPPAYMAKIQGIGNSIYDESNLDYEFYLSPKTIREMRRQTTGSSANYTSFSDIGFKADRNGISRYESAKIRDASMFNSSNSKVPGSGTVAISCNNMISWNNTGACDTVHD